MNHSPAWSRHFRALHGSKTFFLLLLLIPAAAHAQGGSPFDTGFTAMQTLFTGTVAKVASLIAIVLGGYQFAHGEPGAKKALAGVAAGTGIGSRHECPDLALGNLNPVFSQSYNLNHQPMPTRGATMSSMTCGSLRIRRGLNSRKCSPTPRTTAK